MERSPSTSRAPAARQAGREHRAFARAPALGADGAAVQLDNAAHQSETDAEAALAVNAVVLSLKEQIERPQRGFLVHAGTVVADDEMRVPALGRELQADTASRGRMPGRV